MKLKRIISIFLIIFLVLPLFFDILVVKATTNIYIPSDTEVNNAIEEVKREYPDGSKFEGSFDNGVECIGFAKYAFNRIWGVNCNSGYLANEKYKLATSSTSVISEVGSLTGSQVTYNNVKSLFQRTPKGSLVQMCTPSGQHTMLFVSCNDTSIYVLEANVDYHLTVRHSTISYDYFVSRCQGTYTTTSSSGNAVTSTTGVSTYKYNGRKNSSENISNYGTYVKIKNNVGGKYITANGTDVVLKSEDGTYNQVWKIERNTDQSSLDYGSIKLISVTTGKCITMASESNANGVDLYLADDNDKPTQKWYFNKMLVSDSATIMISAQCSRKVVDLTNANNSENAPLAMWEDNRSTAQQFTLSTASMSGQEKEDLNYGTDFYAMIKDVDETKTLTNTTSGITLQTTTGELNQIWKFHKNSDKSYTITSLSNNQYLTVKSTKPGEKPTTSATSMNWGFSKYWAWQGENDFKTGYRFIYADTMLSLINKDKTNIELYNGIGTTPSFLFKIEKQNLYSLRFSSDETWIKVNAQKNMKDELTSSPSDSYMANFLDWSIENGTIATVNSNGVVTGRKVGETKLTATSKYFPDVSVTKTIHIGTKMETATLNKDQVVLKIGDTEDLIVQYSPSDTTEDTSVQWDSSNKKVATVSTKGKVTALSVGTTTITATIAGRTLKCTVKVMEESGDTIKMYLTSNKTNIEKGDTFQVVVNIETPNSNIYEGKIRLGFDDSVLEVPTGSYYFTSGLVQKNVTVTSGTNYVELNYVATSPAENALLNGKNAQIFFVTLKVKENVPSYIDLTQVMLSTDGIKQLDNVMSSIECKNLDLHIAQPLQSIKLDKTELRVPYRDALTTDCIKELKVSLTPDYTNTTLEWSSTNDGIAKIYSKSKDGLTAQIAATGIGNCKIKVKATNNGNVYWAECDVTTIIAPERIQIEEYSLNISCKEKAQLHYSVSPDNTTNKKVKWTSESPEIATVDQSGLVTGVSEGSAKIIVTSVEDERVNDYCYVYVRGAQSGDYIYEVLSDGTIKIKKYKGSDTSVNIPSKIDNYTVTQIDSSVFASSNEVNTKITSIKVPDTVTKIMAGAFNYCEALTTITIPKSVKTIGYGATKGCKKLTQINVDSQNSNYASIDGVLYEKSGNTIYSLLVYPAGKTEATYTSPNTLSRIDSSAFDGNTYLKEINLLKNVNYINYDAIINLPNLQKLYILNKNVNIDNYTSSKAIYNCPKLTIYGLENSTAQTYANGNNIKFVVLNAKITKLTLNNTKVTFTKENESQSISTLINIEPIYATNTELTYTSGNSNIVTVSSTGLIRVVNNGNTEIHIKTTDGSNIEVVLNVEVNIKCTKITAINPSMTITGTKPANTYATAQPNKAKNRVLSYSIKDTTIATIDEYGIVTPIKNGNTTIVVKTTDGSNITLEIPLTVTGITQDVKIKKLTLSNTKVTFTKENETKNISTLINIEPIYATNTELTYTSSNSNVVTVSSTGLIKVVNNGNTEIHIKTTDGSNIEVVLQVEVNIKCTKIAVTNSTMKITGTKPTNTNATAQPSKAKNKALSYSIKDSTIATIDKNGIVTPRKNGNTTIVIKTTDGSNITLEIPLTVTGITQKTSSYTLGDVNNDGRINASDAKLVLLHFAERETLTETQQLAADVNFDGRINASDAKKILLYFAEKITEF